MMRKNKIIGIVFFCLLLLVGNVKVNADVYVSKGKFIEIMVARHGFDKFSLKKIFDQVLVSQSILDAISTPPEKKLSWDKYHKIFITEKRISQGVSFWRENRNKLEEAEQKFGVPAEMVTAIIGVETFYGRILGNYRVIDALNTLAFHYPKRAGFFQGEFEHFLLLTREQGLDPFELKGSYAGAMGLPQFISSSYRRYAIDFDGDGVVDIWNSPDDAIGSVANYFVEHGWKAGKPVAVKMSVENKTRLEKNTNTRFIEYESGDTNEYWQTYDNFHVITRYNNSVLYALAVYQLSSEIKERMQ